MIKAVVFDLQKTELSQDCSFLKKAKNAGLKLACVSKASEPFKERPNPELYQHAFLNLGVGAEETVIISDSPEAQRTARNAKCVSVGIGHTQIDHTQIGPTQIGHGDYSPQEALILKGADLVLESLEAFPNFSSVEEFDAVLFKEVRAFYERTIIGKLLSTAIKVREKAYAPYSNFKVGAGLLTETGKVYAGCNVENASLGATICAERGASMAAIASEGKTKFQMIAIASSAADPAPPCAICRQFLSEFMPPDGQIFMISVTNNVIKHFSFEALLPCTFTEF